MKVSGESYVLMPWTPEHTLYFPLLSALSKAHEGSTPCSLPSIFSNLLMCHVLTEIQARHSSCPCLFLALCRKGVNKSRMDEKLSKILVIVRTVEY